MYEVLMATAEQKLHADLDPRWLRAFLAVARERHFGRAAARLSIGQPSLSRHVQQLERALGVQLFHRTPHGVMLTEVGRVIRPEAEGVLALSSHLLRTARTYTGRSRSTLTVAAPLPSPAGGLLSEAIRRFRGDRGGPEQPQIAVIDLVDEEQTGALAQRRVDAVLTWGRPGHAAFAGEALVEEPVDALFAARHSLAATPQVTVSALADEPLLFPVRERRHCWTLLRDAAEAARTELDPVPTSPAAVLDLVASGLGCSVVPRSLRLSASPELAFVPLRGLSARMSVVWRQADHSPAVTAFVAACRAAAVALTGARPDIWSAPRSLPAHAHRSA
ncbi:LysR family transcriptional regulator [Streptomyces sp. NPDC014676]|uniref:LysR family transcriptional regulator n=1 Tax=Streptomyces sp. NPDC014676 TaxID=3364879 RepID=UPI0036FEB49B